ncbi:MAG: hypothetical protein HY328_04490 [Chloroflexi bacterium]|nr:hypothetical protein [Chloroflexota bacterium]
MKWVQILVAEARRELHRSVAYRLEFVADQVLFILGFLLLSGLFYILSDGGYTEKQQLMSLVGFITWRVADGVILRSVSTIDEETQWGTLEQIWLAPIPPRLVFFCRSTIILVSYMLRAIFIAAILLLSLRLTIHFSISMFAVFLLAQFGVIGTAYILMGLQLAFKRTVSLTLAFTTSLLFVTGALAPIEHVYWLTIAVRFLPLGPGIHLLQAEIEQPLSMIHLWLSNEGIWLVCHSIVYLVLGQIVFAWGERYALNSGHLGQY